MSIHGTINDPTTSKGSSAVTGIEPARIHTAKRASTQCREEIELLCFVVSGVLEFKSLS